MMPLQRHTAKKVRIADLLEGSFTQDGPDEPGYVLTAANQKITRSKLLAIVLAIEQVGSMTNILIDDGTGNITVRFFEESKMIRHLQVGDSFLIIGRIRIYNQEKYVSAEITKKIDPLWRRVQALELRTEKVFPNEEKNDEENKEKKSFSSQKQEMDEPSYLEDPKKVPCEEIIIEEKDDFLFKKIAQLIKDMDRGDGILIEDLLEKSSLEHTEHYVQQMLERGDIFQIRPGRIKVL